MSWKRQAAHARGMAAEQECARLLEGKGYRILGLRVRTAGGELDLVAWDKDTLVIVEVKARLREADALESVTPAKQVRLARATEALLAEPGKIGGLAPGLAPNIRFDVMAVLPGRTPLHLQDAWRPEYACL